MLKKINYAIALVLLFSEVNCLENNTAEAAAETRVNALTAFTNSLREMNGETRLGPNQLPELSSFGMGAPHLGLTLEAQRPPLTLEALCRNPGAFFSVVLRRACSALQGRFFSARITVDLEN